MSDDKETKETVGGVLSDALDDDLMRGMFLGLFGIMTGNPGVVNLGIREAAKYVQNNALEIIDRIETKEGE